MHIGFCAQQLKVCDMKFRKIEDTCHTLSVPLISSYERSTHEYKRERVITQREYRKETIRKQNLRDSFEGCNRRFKEEIEEK